MGVPSQNRWSSLPFGSGLIISISDTLHVFPRKKTPVRGFLLLAAVKIDCQTEGPSDSYTLHFHEVALNNTQDEKQLNKPWLSIGNDA